MEITHGEYITSTNHVRPDNINYYHYTTLYNTGTSRDDFVITQQINSFSIDTTRKYLVNLSFYGVVDAQANTSSVVNLRVFGFTFLTIRAYEAPINYQIQQMQLVVTPTTTTPIMWDTNPIAFRVIATGTIMITPINI